jgi:hypothetical protein
MNMVNQRIFDLVYKDIVDKKDNNVNVTIENHYHGTIYNLTINEGGKGSVYPQVDESDVVGMAAEEIN